MGDDAVSAHEALGLYLLGALPDDERTAFERHLAGCERCTAEALDLGPTTSGFAQFTDEEILALLTEPGTDDSAPPEEPESPATVRPSTRPARPSPRARRRRPLLIAAAALLLIVTGLSMVFLHDTGTSPGTPPVGKVPALAAIAEAESSGVSLSVSVIETPDGQIARATVSGLRAGTQYRLYTAVRGGATHVIADWTGKTGVQEVDGRLPVPADTLAFFSVYVADGGPVITASIAPTTPTPR